MEGGGEAFGGDTGEEEVDSLVGEGEMDVDAAFRAEFANQAAQGGDQREQLGREDVALAQVDDRVAALRREAEAAAIEVEGRAPPGARRR